MIVALAVYFCIINLINSQEWQIDPNAFFYDNKHYSVGAVLDMGRGLMKCAPDPDGSDLPAMWADLP